MSLVTLACFRMIGRAVQNKFNFLFMDKMFVSSKQLLYTKSMIIQNSVDNK